MRNSKLGLRALGIAVLGALSMMAVFAAGAQAQGTAGKFLVNGVVVPNGLNAPIEASNDLLWGQLLIAGRGINVKCKTITLGNTSKITGEAHGEGEVTFGGCAVFSHPGDAALAACTVHSEKQANGTIVAAALILPRLHPAGGNPYVLFEAPTGVLNFTTIEVLGAACAAEGTYPTKGSVVAQVLSVPTTPPELPLVLLDFNEAAQLLLGDSLKFGAFSAYINGEANVKLKGTHVGLSLGVH